MIELRDTLTSYTRRPDTYVPHTYIALRRRFEASVSEFMRTVPESLDDNQRLTIQTYLLSSTWYTWDHYVGFIRSCSKDP